MFQTTRLCFVRQKGKQAAYIQTDSSSSHSETLFSPRLDLTTYPKLDLQLGHPLWILRQSLALFPNPAISLLDHLDPFEFLFTLLLDMNFVRALLVSDHTLLPWGRIVHPPSTLPVMEDVSLAKELQVWSSGIPQRGRRKKTKDLHRQT